MQKGTGSAQTILGSLTSGSAIADYGSSTSSLVWLTNTDTATLPRDSGSSQVTGNYKPTSGTNLLNTVATNKITDTYTFKFKSTVATGTHTLKYFSVVAEFGGAVGCGDGVQ